MAGISKHIRIFFNSWSKYFNSDLNKHFRICFALLWFLHFLQMCLVLLMKMLCNFCRQFESLMWSQFAIYPAFTFDMLSSETYQSNVCTNSVLQELLFISHCVYKCSHNLVRGVVIKNMWSSKQKQQCKNQKLSSRSHYDFLRHLQW